jgi:hypothetical protein
MTVEVFQPHHIDEIALGLQSKQERERDWYIAPGYGSSLLAKGEAFSLMDGHRPIGCGGVLWRWDGCGILWAIHTKHIAAHMLQWTRTAFRFIDLLQARRLEAYIDEDFQEAQRWVDILGFQREGLMRSFTSDGRNQFLYSRVA